jgi:hypothetical protein
MDRAVGAIAETRSAEASLSAFRALSVFSVVQKD